MLYHYHYQCYYRYQDLFFFLFLLLTLIARSNVGKTEYNGPMGKNKKDAIVYGILHWNIEYCPHS